MAGNEYLQAAEPWAKFKTDPDAAAAIIRLSLNLIRLYAVLSEPFIPDASASMLNALGLRDTIWPGLMRDALAELPDGHVFEVPDVLFAKISDEAREGWQSRFAGQSD